MSAQEGFGLWVTGLPASGKSSVTAELVRLLRERTVPVVVLESDEMRRILTPEPDYSEQERDRFYRQMVLLGHLVGRAGINVIFDATGNKRVYRESARAVFTRFIEVYVDSPIEVCKSRDPKGIYARAAQTASGTVPGVQAAYEPPEAADITVDGQAGASGNALSILHYLKYNLYI